LIEILHVRDTGYPCSSFSDFLHNSGVSLEDVPINGRFRSGGAIGAPAELVGSIRQSKKARASRRRKPIAHEIQQLLADFPDLSEKELWDKLTERKSDGSLTVFVHDVIREVDNQQGFIVWDNGSKNGARLRFTGFCTQVRRAKRRQQRDH